MDFIQFLVCICTKNVSLWIVAINQQISLISDTGAALVSVQNVNFWPSVPGVSLWTLRKMIDVTKALLLYTLTLSPGFMAVYNMYNILGEKNYINLFCTQNGQKLYGVLAFLSAIGLSKDFLEKNY